MSRYSTRLLLAALALAAGSARAQEFGITSANVSDGAAGIAAVDTFYFSFNKQLPFNSLFTNGFRWEPPRLTFRQYTYLDANRDRPRFTIEHRAVSDYAVWVYGVRAQDGTPMARPFTLNYTTAATHGERDVSGAVTFAEGTTAALGEGALRVKSLAREALAAPALPEAVQGGEPARRAGVDGTGLLEPASVEARTSAATGLGRSVAAAQDLRATVVFLLDAYTLDAGRWRPRVAAALDADGRYRFDYVRDGTYYPVAINFADADGTTIGAYGYYDPDGDLEPDPITVSGGNVTGVDLALYPYESSTAYSAYDLAASRARAVAADARLVSLSAPRLLAGGAAFDWTYEFHAAGTGTRIVVALDPVAVRTSASEADAVTAGRPTVVPAETVDSDRALEVAEANGGAAFRSRHASQAVTVSVVGGNVPRQPDGDPDAVVFEDPVWQVHYEVSDPAEQITVYLDMRSGAVLDPNATSAEPDAGGAGLVLHPPAPNPFRAATVVTVDLAEPTDVRVAVYDALGRGVAVLTDGPLAAGVHRLPWTPGGAPAGVYLVRVEAGDAVRTARVVLLR